jgi:2-oxoglutarate dehydrogenase E2 component (dihydrolipoamide succinyltransferase)
MAYGSGLDGTRASGLDGTRASGATAAAPAPYTAPAPSAAPAARASQAPAPQMVLKPGDRRVPMSMLRQRIAERLVQAQHTAAILTTFNEADMTEVMAVRAKHKDSFKAKHGVGLGFMSFFTRACVEAFKVVPEVNGTIDGRDTILRDYVDMGIAVGSERGLVVPVLRDAHKMGFVEIEKTILEFATKAKNNKLSIADLTGGTFTISNGGTYGSLLSTPILNPPQSGILGMHKIQERPMVVESGGKKTIEIRPMMYLALSYDHRLIDGKGAVTFLVTVKDFLEHPEKLGLEW